MCFGGGSQPAAPNNPAPYSLGEAYKGVGFKQTDNKTGQVVANKEPVTTSQPATVPQVLSGLNTRGM